ncbi:MAG: ribonuclease III family protein [Candidatus Asgardarchaeia archaeon]
MLWKGDKWILEGRKGSVKEMKSMAKLGDPLVNLIFSLTKSLIYNKASGSKVKGRCLSRAIEKANIRKFFPKRLDSHDIGDFLEAIVATLWLDGVFDLKELCTYLSNEIKSKFNVENMKEEDLMVITFEMFLERYNEEVLKLLT